MSLSPLPHTLIPHLDSQGSLPKSAVSRFTPNLLTSNNCQLVGGKMLSSVTPLSKLCTEFLGSRTPYKGCRSLSSLKPGYGSSCDLKVQSKILKRNGNGLYCSDYVHGRLRAAEPGKSFSERKFFISDKTKAREWDVIGLGQAMVDFSATVSDDLLNKLGLEKGKRKVVNHEERGNVIRALDGNSYKVSAGGSLSNTLVALARLGTAPTHRSIKEQAKPHKLSVAMTGSVGSDPLGDFYRAKLLKAKVHFLSQPITDGTTGTVVVLTTPDAQRTMLSYQGMSSEIACDQALKTIISKSRMLVVEGYLWEIPKTVEAIAQACKAAKENGVLVALTASDVTCVLRHRAQFWEVTKNSADILFSNADEARALTGLPSNSSPALAASQLSKICPLVSVTDGARGSFIGLQGDVTYVPPHPCQAVDTCGAGDAYAAGLLFGLLYGVPDVKSMGSLAARVAGTVVAQHGARLKEEDALDILNHVNFSPLSFHDGSVYKMMENYGAANL